MRCATPQSESTLIQRFRSDRFRTREEYRSEGLYRRKSQNRRFYAKVQQYKGIAARRTANSKEEPAMNNGQGNASPIISLEIGHKVVVEIQSRPKWNDT